MEHYRAMKWGSSALVFSPAVFYAANLAYFLSGGNPFVGLSVVLLVEAYVGFVFYCVLCIPVARRILLLGSIVLIATTASLLFGGPDAAATVLVPGIILCVLGGLPRWVGVGAMIFIANAFILLAGGVVPGIMGYFAGLAAYPHYAALQITYVFLAYIGLGIAVLPYLDWGAYWKGWQRSSRKVEPS